MKEKQGKEMEQAMARKPERASALSIFSLRSAQAFLQPYSSTWNDASAALFRTHLS